MDDDDPIVSAPEPKHVEGDRRVILYNAHGQQLYRPIGFRAAERMTDMCKYPPKKPKKR